MYYKIKNEPFLYSKVMKSKKSSGAFREDNDSLKGGRKLKLTPIKKQKSKRTQFLDEIEDLEEDDFKLSEQDLEDLYDNIEEDFEEEDDEDHF